MVIGVITCLARVHRAGGLADDLAADPSGHDGGPQGDALLRVHLAEHFLGPEELLHGLLHQRYRARVSRHKHVVDLFRCLVGVLQSLPDDLDGPALLDRQAPDRGPAHGAGVCVGVVRRPAAALLVPARKRQDHLLEFVASDLDVDVDEVAVVVLEHPCEEDVCGAGGAEPFLDGLGGLPELGHEAMVGCRIDVVLLPDPLDRVVHDHLVQVVAPEPHVAFQVQGRKDVPGHHEEGHIECSPTQVVDQEGPWGVIR